MTVDEDDYEDYLDEIEFDYDYDINEVEEWLDSIMEKDVKKEADLGYDLCVAGKLDEGIPHLRYAAERNNTNAIVNLGHALKLLGNYEEAFKWTKIGASLKDPTALSNLSIMYRAAQGTICNVEEAVKCGEELIKLGRVAEGYEEIVCAYLYAKDSLQQDFDKAFKVCLEGSKKIMQEEPKKGKNCEVVIQLALCYDFGKGTEIDKKKALDCYEYCISCGSGFSCYNAACILGYSEDEQLLDIDKAIKYFDFAAQLGYTDGYFELGYFYHVGEKVEKDLNKAKYYYSMAIRYGNGEQHYQDAIDNLREISTDTADKILSGKYCSVID
jgi:TPR repeat protein